MAHCMITRRTAARQHWRDLVLHNNHRAAQTQRWDSARASGTTVVYRCNQYHKLCTLDVCISQRPVMLTALDRLTILGSRRTRVTLCSIFLWMNPCRIYADIHPQVRPARTCGRGDVKEGKQLHALFASVLSSAA